MQSGLPLTVKVKPGPPALALEGESPAIAGTTPGCGAAMEEELHPPHPMHSIVSQLFVHLCGHLFVFADICLFDFEKREGIVILIHYSGASVVKLGRNCQRPEEGKRVYNPSRF